MKNFDSFIGIDWSGAKSVYTPSISVARIDRTSKRLSLVKNKHHKYWSRTDVFKFILDLAQGNKRILIGIDCNFGYSHDVGVRQFGSDYTAHDLWHAVEAASHDDNFYAGGFWNDKRYAPYFWTHGKQPAWFDAHALQRQTEKTCIANGYGRPESPFKLFSAKQVGKGGMAGMRMAYALKRECQNAIAFWPFEHNKVNQAQVVISEIFPRQFMRRFGHGNTKIRSLDDLRVLLLPYAKIVKSDTITDHDADALVTAVGLKYLCGDGKDVPPYLAQPPCMKAHHAACEGWIFGVGDCDES